LPEAEHAALLGVRGEAQHIRASEHKRLACATISNPHAGLVPVAG
jgi:hypothetical protein